MNVESELTKDDKFEFGESFANVPQLAIDLEWFLIFMKYSEARNVNST